MLVLALVVGGSLPARGARAAQAGPLVDWSLPVLTPRRAAGGGRHGRHAALRGGAGARARALAAGGGAGALRAASRSALGWSIETLLTGPMALARLVGTSPTGLTAVSVRT